MRPYTNSRQISLIGVPGICLAIRPAFCFAQVGEARCAQTAQKTVTVVSVIPGTGDGLLFSSRGRSRQHPRSDATGIIASIALSFPQASKCRALLHREISAERTLSHACR